MEGDTPDETTFIPGKPLDIDIPTEEDLWLDPSLPEPLLRRVTPAPKGGVTLGS